jgi:nicotinate-nucleotide pyrophosphorylase (carboxylating)
LPLGAHPVQVCGGVLGRSEVGVGFLDIRRLVALAIDEDVGHGDLTTAAVVPPDLGGAGEVLAKQCLVVAGHAAAAAVFAEVAHRTGADASYEPTVPEGEEVPAGTVVARASGRLGALLMAERTALNLLMRMCGIATNTRRYVDAAGADGPVVVDTRKTTPLHRSLEKHAVVCGGGRNHRHALFDGVLIKDNHVDAVGSLGEAVRRARAASHHLVRIEVEVRTLAEVDEALATEADVLLLDNMDDETLREAVRRARAAQRPAGVGRVLLEASGNMTVARISQIRSFGLDFVSVGGLIHQATWADLSLKVRPERV